MAADSTAGSEPPPIGLWATARRLGPGLIVTAIVVGSGELIVTPKLGAEQGFTLLWFIVLGCLLKVFVQIEFGRMAIIRGLPTLQALNLLPGPRYLVSWILWIWLLMYCCLVLQVGGMVGGAAQIVGVIGLPGPSWVAVLLVAGAGVGLLIMGSYGLVERMCLLLIGLFLLTTVGALWALQLGDNAITGAQLIEGMSFQLPDKITTAFATFGVIGIGASELIYYPYWCLEKGYARFTGEDDGSEAWQQRARGWLRVMKMDAWVSCAVYTVSTLGFYLLGAAILHARQQEVGDHGMVDTLSMMYRETIGEGSHGLFLWGAFAVLFSTVFAATASNARLLVDGAGLFGLKRFLSQDKRAWMIKAAGAALLVLSTAVFLLSETPVTLVMVGAAAQGLMLPFLGWAAVYFHYHTPAKTLRAGPVSLAVILLAAGLMSALGAYQLLNLLFSGN